VTQSQSAGRFGAGVSGRARRALSLQGRDPRLYRDPQANALADQYAAPLIVRQDRADGKPVRRLALNMGSVRVGGTTATTALTQSITNPPTQSEVENIQDKVNELVALNSAVIDRIDALIRQLRGD